MAGAVKRELRRMSLKRLLTVAAQNTVMTGAVVIIAVAASLVLKQVVAAHPLPIGRRLLFGSLALTVVTGTVATLLAQIRWRQQGSIVPYRVLLMGRKPPAEPESGIWLLGRLAIACWVLTVGILIGVWVTAALGSATRRSTPHDGPLAERRSPACARDLAMSTSIADVVSLFGIIRLGV